MRARDVIRKTFGIAVLVAAMPVTALAALWAYGSGKYLAYVATRGDLIDFWALISFLTVLFAIIGIAGAWLFLLRKRPGLAAAFLLLPFPAPFLLEANRCDYYPACEVSDWARLPLATFDWKLRIRDVDARTAESLAGQALRDAGLPYHAGDPRRVAGEWHVETVTDDLDRAPYDAIVEAKTGEARIVRREGVPK